jgi:hypothetical protein
MEEHSLLRKTYFGPLAHVSGPMSNKLVVVVLVGNVHTFKYGAIMKKL